MEVSISYKCHKYFNYLCFWTTVKIGTRSLTKFSPTRLTNKELRKLKKAARESNKISFRQLGRFHDKTCPICKKNH